MERSVLFVEKKWNIFDVLSGPSERIVQLLYDKKQVNYKLFKGINNSINIECYETLNGCGNPENDSIYWKQINLQCS